MDNADYIQAFKRDYLIEIVCNLSNRELAKHMCPFSYILNTVLVLIY